MSGAKSTRSRRSTRTTRTTRTGYSRSKKSKDPYENLDTDGFDALIDQTEKEINKNLIVMRRINGDRFATGQNKAAKIGPVK